MCPALAEVRARRRGLAGAAGFEPANGGIKSRCLTTWRRPNGKRAYRALEEPFNPAVRIGRGAALDRHQLLAKLLGAHPRPAVSDREIEAAAADPADWRDHRGSAAGK